MYTQEQLHNLQLVQRFLQLDLATCGADVLEAFVAEATSEQDDDDHGPNPNPNQRTSSIQM